VAQPLRVLGRARATAARLGRRREALPGTTPSPAAALADDAPPPPDAAPAPEPAPRPRVQLLRASRTSPPAAEHAPLRRTSAGTLAAAAQTAVAAESDGFEAVTFPLPPPEPAAPVARPPAQLAVARAPEAAAPPVTPPPAQLAVARAPEPPPPSPPLEAAPAPQPPAAHAAAPAHAAEPDYDAIYEHVVRKLRRDLLREREQMGDLLGDLY
jgi:hypothetical protein